MKRNPFYEGIIAALLCVCILLVYCRKPQQVDCPPTIEQKAPPAAKEKTTIEEKKSETTIENRQPTLATKVVAKKQPVAPAPGDDPVEVTINPADYEGLPYEVTVALQDYNTDRDYLDRYPFGDDTVEVASNVHHNRQKLEVVKLIKSDKVITKEKTITPKLRNKVFIGINGQYATPAANMAVGPSLMFQSKRDRIFEAAALVDTRGNIIYQGSMKFKISLRK